MIPWLKWLVRFFAPKKSKHRFTVIQKFKIEKIAQNICYFFDKVCHIKTRLQKNFTQLNHLDMGIK